MGVGDGQIRPLALGLHAQVGTHLLKEPAPYLIRGDRQLPAQDKPFQDLGRVRRWVGAQQGLGGEGALGIAVSTQRMRTGGLPERYQTAVCDVSSTVRVVPSYQAHGHTGPSYLGLVEEGLQRGSPRSFQRRT